MSGPLTSSEILDREFLPTRAKILEIAASLDRVSRAAERVPADSRWSQLHSAIELVLEHSEDRAELVQLLFSRPYDANWQSTLGVKK